LVGNFHHWLQLNVNYISVQEWCVEQGFELVELNPELDLEWEEEQDFIETTGIKRVVQALHAHVWPNLHMKGKGTLVCRLLILLVCRSVCRVCFGCCKKFVKLKLNFIMPNQKYGGDDTTIL
jgi:hypothetical protein